MCTLKSECTTFPQISTQFEETGMQKPQRKGEEHWLEGKHCLSIHKQIIILSWTFLEIINIY